MIKGIKKGYYSGYFTFFLIILLHSFVLSQNDYSETINELDDFYNEIIKEWEVPGMAIAIVKDDSIILSKGYGVNEINTNSEVNEHTLFPVASNTKSFTTAAMAILVDEGKATWDDRVKEHLPWFYILDAYTSDNMTIRDLLSHRSGLKTFSGDLLWYGTEYDSEEVVRRARYLGSEHGLREHYGYSNIMYIAAGEIIEKVSGKSYDSFIKDNFFVPLNMDRTVTSVTCFDTMENITSPHTYYHGQIIPIKYINWDNVTSAGGIISCVDDMANWLKLQLNRGIWKNDTLFEPRSANEMWKPHTIQNIGSFRKELWPSTHFRAYGLGWQLMDYQGRKIISHSGGYDGIISQMAIVAEDSLGIVILTNKNSYLILPVLYQTLHAFLVSDKEEKVNWGKELFGYKEYVDERNKKSNEQLEKQRIDNTSPSFPLTEYTGTYIDKMYGNAIIYLDNESLKFRLSPTENFTGDLVHYHYNVFMIEFKKFPSLPKGLVTFILNYKGKIDKMLIHLPNPDFDFSELEFIKE